MGLPVEYSPEVADAICERLAVGESLRHICAQDGMPRMASVFRWLAANEAFREQYARAREEQAESYADEITQIADEEIDPQRARVRIDARKWVASKLKPKKYGDKVTTELTGADGKPLQIEAIERRIVDPRN
mgnify:CR=1 FL=1